MDSIIKNLQDPSWWFTGVVVAIIASLLAAYIKDVFNFAFSAISGRYKRWREIKKAKETEEIDEIASDPTLLMISFGWILWTLLEFVFCAIAFMLFPLGQAQLDMLHLQMSRESSDSIMSPLSVSLIFVLATMYIAYLLGARYRKFRRAYELYVEKKRSA